MNLDDDDGDGDDGGDDDEGEDAKIDENDIEEVMAMDDEEDNDEPASSQEETPTELILSQSPELMSDRKEIFGSLLSITGQNSVTSQTYI